MPLGRLYQATQAVAVPGGEFFRFIGVRKVMGIGTVRHSLQQDIIAVNLEQNSLSGCRTVPAMIKYPFL